MYDHSDALSDLRESYACGGGIVLDELRMHSSRGLFATKVYQDGDDGMPEMLQEADSGRPKVFDGDAV